NDFASANLKLDANGRPAVYPVEFMADDTAQDQTESLKLTYVFGTDVTTREIPIDPRDIAAQLRGTEVTLFFARYRPKPATRDELLKQIRDELNAIRFNQFRTP